jgi:hypothetical protein
MTGQARIRRSMKRSFAIEEAAPVNHHEHCITSTGESVVSHLLPPTFVASSFSFSRHLSKTFLLYVLVLVWLLIFLELALDTKTASRHRGRRRMSVVTDNANSNTSKPSLEQTSTFHLLRQKVVVGGRAFGVKVPLLKQIDAVKFQRWRMRRRSAFTGFDRNVTSIVSSSFKRNSDYKSNESDLIMSSSTTISSGATNPDEPYQEIASLSSSLVEDSSMQEDEDFPADSTVDQMSKQVLSATLKTLKAIDQRWIEEAQSHFGDFGEILDPPPEGDTGEGQASAENIEKDHIVILGSTKKNSENDNEVRVISH